MANAVLSGIRMYCLYCFVGISVASNTVSSTFAYNLCPSRHVTSDVISAGAVRSLLDCVTACAAHGPCRSVSVCTGSADEADGGDWPVCTLSSSSLQDCQSLTLSATNGCSFIYMVDQCQHGGSFNKVTLACDCPTGWEGSLCEQEKTTTTQKTTTTTVDPNPASCWTGSACDGIWKTITQNGEKKCCPSHSVGVQATCKQQSCTCQCTY